jgi:hypothetical protein
VFREEFRLPASCCQDSVGVWGGAKRHREPGALLCRSYLGAKTRRISP